MSLVPFPFDREYNTDNQTLAVAYAGTTENTFEYNLQDGNTGLRVINALSVAKVCKYVFWTQDSSVTAENFYNSLSSPDGVGYVGSSLANVFAMTPQSVDSRFTLQFKLMDSDRYGKFFMITNVADTSLAVKSYYVTSN